MPNDSRLALLPKEKIEAVKTGLQKAFGAVSVDELLPLVGGLSTALIYKVIVQGKAYVLRVIMANPFTMESDTLTAIEREFTCMKIAAEAGIAPHLYYANAEDGVAIMDLIEEVRAELHFANKNDHLFAIAQTIRAIHALPLFPKSIGYLEWLETLIEEFKASKELPEGATAEHFRHFDQILQRYPRNDPDVVSSHNELNPANLLFDGKKFWVIDWEIAGQNDRYLDLAANLNIAATNPAEEEVMLRAYFGDALNEKHRARIFIAQQISFFYYAMDMMRFAIAEKPAGAFADANMETPEFDEWIRQAERGEVGLDSYEGKILFIKVILNEALRNMKSQRFLEAMKLLN